MEKMDILEQMETGVQMVEDQEPIPQIPVQIMEEVPVLQMEQQVSKLLVHMVVVVVVTVALVANLVVTVLMVV